MSEAPVHYLPPVSFSGRRAGKAHLRDAALESFEKPDGGRNDWTRDPDAVTCPTCLEKLAQARSTGAGS